MGTAAVHATRDTPGEAEGPRAGRARDLRRIVIAMLGLAAGAAALIAAALRVWIAMVERGMEVIPERTGEAFVAMYLHAAIAATAVVAVLALRRRKRPVGERAARWTVAALALAGLLCVDRLAGFAAPPPDKNAILMAPHEVRGWCLRPGLSGAESSVRTHINSHGFRGPEYPLDKPPGEFRAMFFGDSIVFGYGLADESTLSGQAEARWRREFRPNLRVINTGVGAYTTWQEVDVLESQGLEFKPDLAVLFFCINDMVDVIYREPRTIGGRPRFEAPRLPHWSGLVRAVASLYAEARDRRIRDAVAWSTGNPFEGPDDALRGWEDLFREPPLPQVAAAWRQIEDELDRFRELCRSNDVNMALVLTTSMWQLGEEERHRQPTQILGAWAQSRGVPFLDLTSVYRKAMAAGEIERNQLLLDAVHPTSRANEIAIEELTELLKREGMLPADRGK